MESRNLIKLRLGNNPYLNMVDTDAFLGLTALRELDLQRNGFTLLDVRVLEPLRSLQILHVEGNPWLCNCNFAKLYLWLTENQHKLPTGKTYDSLTATSLVVKGHKRHSFSSEDPALTVET